MTDEELAAKLAELGEALNSSVLGCLNQDGIGDTILLASSRLYALSAHVALLKASLAQAEREAEKPAASAEPVSELTAEVERLRAALEFARSALAGKEAQS